jgi:hypothetical protein
VASKKTVIKNIPRTEAENLNEAVPVFTDGASKPDIRSYKRAEDTSLRGEDLKSISVGIEDIDEAVLYYFNEVIKPYVINDGTTYSIPVVYADPERWKSAQKDGGIRDKEGRIQFPIITVKRENLERNRNISNKLDGNAVNVYQVYEKRYSKKNQYDNFSILTNSVPVKEFYNVVVPDYYTITYSCAVYVSFIQDLNKIIESIGFREGSYWGLPNRFLFKSTIDNFPITNQITDGEDRKIVSVFTLTLNGYLTPNNIDKQLAANAFKSRSKSKLIFTLEATNSDVSQTTVPMKKNVSLAATAFIPEGVTVYNETIVSISSNIVNYINTNKAKKADYVSGSYAAFYNSSMLPAPSGIGLPDTSIADFKFFVNGVYVPSLYTTTFAPSGSALVLNLDTVGLGYGLDQIDEVIGVGKFS